MINTIEELHNSLTEIDEEYGGDIGFIPPTSEDKLLLIDIFLKWKLPEVFRHFYTKECNGLIIGNRRILSIKDDDQKKTLVDSIQRHNHPDTSFWFKKRPHIFNDYVVIGLDGDICFCLSKKYDIPNPSIYICENSNSAKGVDFERLDLDLNGLINQMIQEEFE